MTSRIPSRQKWSISTALMTLFYGVILYVNLLDRTWSGFLNRGIKVIVPEYLIGIAVTFLFIILGERILEFFDRYYSRRKKQIAQFRINVYALLVFLFCGVFINYAAFVFIKYFLIYVTGTPDNTLKQANTIAQQSIRISYGLIFILIIFIYFVLTNRRMLLRAQAIKIKYEQLEKEKARQSFITLQNQVNPHFLFNNLSVLSSLVKKDAELSEQFIDNLSKVYRYIFEQKENQLVPLKKELDYINAYLFLQQVRFGKKLEVKIMVPVEQAERYLVAPFILQHLMETALKHNRMSLSAPLQMEITLEDKNILSVQNCVQVRGDEAAATKEAYRHIIDQYRLLSDHAVAINHTDNAFFVKIPLLIRPENQK